MIGLASSNVINIDKVAFLTVGWNTMYPYIKADKLFILGYAYWHNTADQP
jgi:hypothetical protein